MGQPPQKFAAYLLVLRRLLSQFIVRQQCSEILNVAAAGIYVRTYENRMDLLSVLIIGPASTPYLPIMSLVHDIRIPSHLHSPLTFELL